MHLLSIVLLTVPFELLGRPHLETCPDSADRNQIGKVIKFSPKPKSTRYVYSTNMGSVNTEANVEENISALAVVMQRHNRTVQNVNQNKKLTPFLKFNYWQEMLPKVYSKEYSSLLITQLTEGVRIGRPPADMAVISLLIGSLLSSLHQK